MSPTVHSAGSADSQALDASGQATFSTKPFSLSLANAKATKVVEESRPLKSRKRPHAALADDSDPEDANQHEQPQLVTTFGQGQGDAADADRKSAPLVISSQRNRDWRAESYKRRGKNILPAEERAAREGKLALLDDAADDEKPQYGLVLSTAQPEAGDVAMREAGIAIEAVEPVPRTAQSADDEAMAALLGEKSSTSTLVLPAVGSVGTDDPFAGRISGEDAFRSAVALCPDSASLDAYAAVPIEEFGAALLRGMGWRDGEAVGRRKDVVVKARIVARRPALLGIGAKEAPEGLEELGAWGKGAKKKAEKYHPVLLRNSKTGEMVTEEELKAKRDKEERIEADDWRARRDRNLRIDDGRKMVVARGQQVNTRDRSRSRDRKRSKRDDELDRREPDGGHREAHHDRRSRENGGREHGRHDSHTRDSSNSNSNSNSHGHGHSRRSPSKHGRSRHDERKRDENRNDSRSASHRKRDDRRHGQR